MMEQYEDLFKSNEELVELVADTWKARGFYPSTLAQKINIFFVAKAYKSLRAVLHLCRQGYGEDAGIILRSLFEIQVNAWYIGDDEDRAQRYADFDAVYAYRLLEEPVFDYLSDKLNEDRVREIREECEKAQAKHNYKGSVSWSGKSIKTMAEDVGLGGGYASLYVLMSQLTHSTAGVMRDYVQEDIQTSVIRVKLLPSDNLIREDLLNTLPLMLNVVKQWDMQFNLGIENRIAEIDSRIVELNAKYV